MAKDEIRHEFTTIADLMAVPSDKIDALCEDLRGFLHMNAVTNAALADFIAAGQVVPGTTFRWIDDGKHDATITLRPLDEAPR